MVEEATVWRGGARDSVAAPHTAQRDLVVVVPVYNEEDGLLAVLDGIEAEIGRAHV